MSDTSKHTPGPWSYDGIDDGIIRTAQREIVAEVMNCHDVTLVASAPELLEACKGALDLLRDLSTHPELIEQVSSAIAKAEARS